jgi:hypothetical protein
MARQRNSRQSRIVSGQKTICHKRGETKMKKLISITLLSAVAMLAAPKAPKAQNTTAPTTSTKVTKKNHTKKAKTAVKPVAATTPSK